jgi:hypothetical protein
MFIHHRHLPQVEILSSNTLVTEAQPTPTARKREQKSGMFQRRGCARWQEDPAQAESLEGHTQE